ncbi:MAG: ExeM/NucH family extracellular endonuclease [Nitrosomonas sp.]|nr:ExeM/NucH family extracellular endonuclease [Nitrosomonas sp.]
MATVLSAGDIAIIGFNFDNPDEFAFVSLVDLEVGTEIKFTDNGWLSTNAFRSTEGTFSWIAPAPVSAGTVINPAVSSVLFSASGDQILAYQGDETNPTFLYAVNSEGAGVWQSDATNSNTSALPSGLVNGETAVALDEIDNAVYVGPTSDTKAALLAAIGDKTNWTGDNSIRQTIPNTAFNVTDHTNIAINEIRIDQPGADADEYFELYGNANASLDGFYYIVIGDGTGGGGVVENVTDLSGLTLDANGLFVAAESAFALGAANLTTPLNFENSDNVTHLLVKDFTGANGDDLDTNDDGVLDATPWSTIADSVAMIQTIGSGDQVYSTTQAGPDGAFVPGHIYRSPDGAGDFQIGQFDVIGGNDTPGQANFVTPPPPPAELTAIYTIQGSGDASPLINQSVTIEGIVTGDFQNIDADNSRNLNGFYVQEAVGDGDSATSDGIFVFDPTQIQDVNPGDKVRITGTVSEFFGETQVEATGIEIIGAGTINPVNVSLPTVDVITNSDGTLIANLEPYEGMLVTFNQALTISEFFNYDRFGEIRLTEGDRPFQFTQIFDPSVTGNQSYLESIAGRTIALDDGLSIQNPDPLPYPSPEFSDANHFRGGDTIMDLTGNVRFSRGSGGSGDEIFRIMPTEDPVVTSVNERPLAPDNVGGSLKVASMNVLNYFTTIDLPGNTTANGSDPRGADNQGEFLRQTEKLVTTIIDMDADVLGLVELENDFQPGSSGNAIEFLVNQLNARLGANVYDWVNPGQQFVDVSDAISVGAIYKTASVNIAPGTTPAILTDSNLPAGFEGMTIFDGPSTNRAPLAVTFEEQSTGEWFTIAVNHFKSKGSVFDSANADIGDGQGNNNPLRVKAADALDAWLSSDPTNSGDNDFLILGDLNAYAKEDPVTTLEAAGFTNLASHFSTETPYSYLFDGQLGTLDYALSNSSLTSQITGATEWHINADEADLLDYNLDFGRNPDLFNGFNPFRTSDHDPIILGMTLSTPGSMGYGGNGSNTILGTAGNDKFDGDNGDDIIMGGNGRDALRGGNGNDWISGENGNDTLFGGFGDDLLNGGRGDDLLMGNQGDDQLIGGKGVDTAIFSGILGEYTFTQHGGDIYVASNTEGFDILTDIEIIAFSGDGSHILAVDLL